MEKRQWRGRLTFKITGFDAVNIVGRDPVRVPDADHRKALTDIGVFSDLGDGRMKYIGGAKVLKSDGGFYEIDQSGFVEFDRALLEEKTRDSIDSETIAA